MVLHLFAVGAVADVRAVVLTEGHAGRHRQRDSLVGRSEQHVKLRAEGALNGLGVILAQLAQLRSRAVKTSVYKKRSLSAALGHEIAEPQNLAVDHELNKFLLITFHILKTSCTCGLSFTHSSDAQIFFLILP